MSNFDHYHDMDHDGDHDQKDSGMFHDMEEYHGKVQPAGKMGSISLSKVFSLLFESL